MLHVPPVSCWLPLKPYFCIQTDKITRLMGCLCYTKRLERSPYADLLAESQWDAIAQEFVRQCCGLMGLVSHSMIIELKSQSPHKAYADLLVDACAGAGEPAAGGGRGGSVALPTLLKLA